jgi:hypothetical protein
MFKRLQNVGGKVIFFVTLTTFVVGWLAGSTWPGYFLEDANVKTANNGFWEAVVKRDAFGLQKFVADQVAIDVASGHATISKDDFIERIVNYEFNILRLERSYAIIRGDDTQADVEFAQIEEIEGDASNAVIRRSRLRLRYCKINESWQLVYYSSAVVESNSKTSS